MAFTDTTMFFNQNISHRHHCLLNKGRLSVFRKYNNRGSAGCSYVFSGNYCALLYDGSNVSADKHTKRNAVGGEDGGQRSIYEAGSHSGRD